MNFKDFWQDSLIQKISRLGHLSIDYIKYFSFLTHSKFLLTFFITILLGYIIVERPVILQDPILYGVASTIPSGVLIGYCSLSFAEVKRSRKH